MDKKHRMVVYLPERMHKQLKRTLAENGYTISAWARVAAKMYLEEEYARHSVHGEADHMFKM